MNDVTIKTALLCAMLAKSSLDMLGRKDALVIRSQLRKVAEDFKALAEHIQGAKMETE